MTSSSPQIDLIPLRAVLASGQPTTLDLVVKITPPAPTVEVQRPPLNLGLVIDRSGSMTGAKIDYARQAACYAVEQLLPTDRVSVTIFDDRIETIVPSTPALQKTPILQAIQQVSARGSTALHGAWIEGGMQVGQQLQPAWLNRVILLSDGLANVGETNPDVIAADVHGLSKRGISTTTMGVGNDYNEDMLEAMARSGDGNFYHIESPQQLPSIFQTELFGLMGTIGHQVSLGIEPQSDVAVVDVFNDLDRNQYGRLQLPNLIVGMPILIALRLKVPALTESTEFCRFRLAWNDPNQAGRQVLRVSLRLPIVPGTQLEEFPLNPIVQEQIALLLAARAKAEAVRQLDLGNFAEASKSLQCAQQAVAAAPASALTQTEMQRLQDLDKDITNGEIARSRKNAVYQRYSSERSRPV